MNNVANFWTDKIGVLFTSFWGWDVEKWAAVGWTHKRGRENKLEELSDPFICVCYVTTTSPYADSDEDEKGKICGFLLVSHQTGDRNDFIHPDYHDLEPRRWRYSLKTERAFSYLPEYRPIAKEMFPELSTGAARSIGAYGKVITDRRNIIKELRNLPSKEVEIFSPRTSNI